MLKDRITKTLKGTVIKRSKYGVGKDIGGEIYLHKNYENVVPNQAALKDAKDRLKKERPAFKYNCLKFDKTGSFTFFDSPDFDSADEPVAGKYIKVAPNAPIKESATKSIWHHKWLWVKDDYRGFDVDASIMRSQAWLKIPNVDFARIGSKEFWEANVVPHIK